MSDALVRITEAMPKLSKGKRRLADFILTHYDKAAYMTASKLGAEVGVSESTVVRFADNLGYDGYPELQRVLQDTVRMRLTALQRIEVTNDRLARGGNILDNILASDADKIKYTAEHIDRNAFDAAVNALTEARCIYIIGARSSAILAEFLNHYLSLVLPNIRLVRTTSESDIFEQLMHITSEDVLFAISFPRYSTRIVNAVRFAESENARVIALTDSMSSPLTEYAYAALTARSDIASFADSLVAPLSIINAIIATIGQKKQDEISDVFTRLEAIWDKYNVYQKNSQIPVKNYDVSSRK